MKNLVLLMFEHYLMKRIKRIYPPLIAVLILMYILYVIVVKYNLHGATSFILENSAYIPREKYEVNLKNLLEMILMLPRSVIDISVPTTNGPLWSLSLEVWYYIILLLIYVFFTCYNVFTKGLMLLLIGCAIGFEAFYQGGNYQFLYLLFVFLFGALTNFLILAKSSLMKNKNLYKMMSIMSLISSTLYLTKGNMILVPYANHLNYIFMLNNILILSLFFLAYRDKCFIFDAFFKKISSYSYSLYILHFPIFLFILCIYHKKIINYSMVELILFSVVSVFIIAKLFGILFERQKSGY